MSTDFSTIDRLVEFGMGTALASQMIKTMNQSMASMQTAGVTATAPGVNAPRPACTPEVPAVYYAAIDGRQAGPLSESDMKALIAKGLLTVETLVWRPGMQGWRQAGDVAEVNKLILLS